MLMTSCFRSSDSFTPKSLIGYIIEVNTLKASGNDLPFLHKSVYYYFEPHDLYYMMFEGKKYEQGEYAYQAMNGRTASVIHTYSDAKGLYNYKLVCTFDAVDQGTWKGSYRTDHEITASGTFRILRHGR